MDKIMMLHAAKNWRGIVALEEVVSSEAAHLWATRPDVAAQIYFKLGDSYQGLGLLKNLTVHGPTITRAIGVFEKALATAKEIGDSDGWESQGRACVKLGHCYVSLGDRAKAIEMFEQGLAIFEELGDRSEDLEWLGTCYQSFGMLGKAIELYEQDYAIAKKMGDRARIGIRCFELGICHKSLCENHTAIRMLETVHDIAGRLYAIKVFGEIQVHTSVCTQVCTCMHGCTPLC